jgi:hypothetical protein
MSLQELAKGQGELLVWALQRIREVEVRYQLVVELPAEALVPLEAARKPKT